MARLVHSRGDLQMSIEGLHIEGDKLCINGKMGIWNAQIFLLPEEVAAIVGFLLQPQIAGYMVRLPWRLRRGRHSADR